VRSVPPRPASENLHLRCALYFAAWPSHTDNFFRYFSNFGKVRPATIDPA